ncbi:GspH/FimT family pseudopilin [Ferrimonas balearica]|uniref:GspH/FimT family pseudopilin n=1 Tax=Ferrimonas balearica TaxID=44012 RepID=UPI001C9952D7|nr:GspH/FimT family pseudopilin [Ferrimonas balearica]MBY5922808.1 GspH/FimT family pseudopilin [Ferrimonas balearica]MBY5997815.1 GspH/FimT family pseudopilin [Ferrimonas balearica]
MRFRASKSPQSVRGLTLLELLIAVLILAILLAIGIPSFSGLSQDLRLKGAGFALLETVHQARTEAIKRNLDNITVKFISSGGTWCYRITDTPAACSSCDMTGQTNQCDVEGDGIVKGAGSADYQGVALNNSFSGGVITISNRRGTMPAGNATFSMGSDKSVRVRVSNIGRVSLCVPSTSEAITGVEGC